MKASFKNKNDSENSGSDNENEDQLDDSLNSCDEFEESDDEQSNNKCQNYENKVKSSFLADNKGSANQFDLNSEQEQSQDQANPLISKFKAHPLANLIQAILNAKNRIDRTNTVEVDNNGFQGQNDQDSSMMVSIMQQNRGIPQISIEQFTSSDQEQNLRQIQQTQRLVSASSLLNIPNVDDETSKTLLKKAIKQVEFELIEDEDDMAEKYKIKIQNKKQERMNSIKSKGEETKGNGFNWDDRQLSLMPNANNRHDYLIKNEVEQECRIGDEDDIQDINSSDDSDEDNEDDDRFPSHFLRQPQSALLFPSVNGDANKKSNFTQSKSNSNMKQVAMGDQQYPQSQIGANMQGTSYDPAQNQALSPLSGGDRKRKRRVTVCVKKNQNITPSSGNNEQALQIKKKITKKRGSAQKQPTELIKVKSVATPLTNQNTVKVSSSNLQNEILSLDKSKSQISNITSQFSMKTISKKKRSNTNFLEKHKNMKQYHEVVMSDKNFKQVYADNLNAAIFTFPKFKRNYSKNYVKVQQSYTKFSKNKRTIIFDIDETLVYASHDKNEIPQSSIDTTIRIKVNRFGGAQKAYLSFRPYVFDMLDELYPDFELILYTCGTQSYAKAFSEAVHKFYMDKFPNGHHANFIPGPDNNFAQDFSLFDHVLSLQQCLYSYENDLYIKDLKILEMGRDLKDVVIVDNNVQSFYLQLTNGIPIYDYEGDKTDNILINLTAYLKQFLHIEDVREKVNKDFQIMKILEEKGALDKIDI
eukprot:403351931